MKVNLNTKYSIFSTFLCLLSVLFITSSSFAQSQIFPYSYHEHQRINSTLYNLNTRFHTSIKPIYLDDTLAYKASDSLSRRFVDTTKISWLYRKTFNEHLIQIEKKDFNVYIDFL